MTRDNKEYRILVIEDNPGDFIIVEDLLAEEMLKPVITHAVNFKQALEMLATGADFDIALLDLSLPDKSGQQLVTEILKITTLCCPVIILTGYTDIDFSIKSVSLGISDYLIKDDLNSSMLYKSIIYAIERKKAVSELEKSQKQYSDLFNLSPEPMWLLDIESCRFVKVNKAAITDYGYTEKEMLNMTLMDIKLEEDIPKAMADVRSDLKRAWDYKNLTKHRKKNGEVIEVEISSTPISINNKKYKSIIAIDVTEKNQYENKITRAIIKTQEDERYEIGGELHDNVCQLLAACQLNFGMVRASIIPSRIELFTQGQEYITMVLSEIRNISHRLAPAFFDECTLEDAFKKLFKNFNVDGKYEIQLHYGDVFNKYPLPIDLQLNLYRILQEQLKNIQKYAHAGVIKVDVVIHNKLVKMSISDNGIGFDSKAVTTGIGLANMKRRTELFSGELKIESSPGTGCTIIISIPMAENSTGPFVKLDEALAT